MEIEQTGVWKVKCPICQTILANIKAADLKTKQLISPKRYNITCAVCENDILVKVETFIPKLPSGRSAHWESSFPNKI